MELAINQIQLEFSLIREIPQSAHHGCDFLDLLIEIPVMTGGLVNGLIELKLPVGVLLDVFAQTELVNDWYGEIAVVFDDLVEIGGEPIETIDLLPDETSFLEVAVEHFPHVLFGYDTLAHKPLKIIIWI